MDIIKLRNFKLTRREIKLTNLKSSIIIFIMKIIKNIETSYEIEPILNNYLLKVS